MPRLLSVYDSHNTTYIYMYQAPSYNSGGFVWNTILFNGMCG